MRKFLRHPYVQIALRAIVGGVFIYAGMLKIMSPQEFADNIAAYQLLRDSLINLLALGLPVFEVIVGVMLITGLRVRTAAFCALFLCVVFAIALGSALVRGLQIDCGCFGDGAPSVVKTWFALGRDVALGVAAWIIREFGNAEQMSRAGPDFRVR
jgi:uncharacterized membrane protein YphA (DoxX/SURF4 family)